MSRHSNPIVYPGDGCKLIVNADDLGISLAVNNGIVRAHLQGIVTSASIVPNGKAFNDAVNRIKQIPSLDVGIHLTLIEENPVLDVDKVSSLVDQSGRLHKHAYTFVRQYVTGRIRLKEVEDELTAQIEKVVATGLKISHLNSHQHMHMLPGIFRLVVRLAQKYNIKAVRISREHLRPRMFALKTLKRVMELLAINTLSKVTDSRATKSAGNFLGLYDAGHLNLDNLTTVLNGIKRHGVYELMCHPGVADPTSDYLHWGYSPEEELEALTAPETRKIIVDKNIELTTYGALIGGDV